MRVLTLVSAILVLLLLAACGGAAAPSAGGADPEVPSAGDPEAPTEAPAPSDGGGEPAASEGGGGGTAAGFASRPCDLLTQADAEAVAGVSGLTSEVLAVDAMSGICSWRDANAQVEVFAGVWEQEAAEGQWASLEYLADLGSEDIEKVEGLGGDAIYTESGSVLLVFKNGTLVQLTVRSPELDEPERKAAALELGKRILARL